MLEQPLGKTEKDRSRLIMLSGGAAVVLVIGLIILVSSYCGRAPKVGMARPGSPEFDSYSSFVSLAITEMKTGERVTGKYGRIRGSARNDGDQVLTGLQVRGIVLGFDNDVLKEKVMTLVPTLSETLEPHESMKIDLYIDPIPDQIMDMRLEIYALKVK